MYKLLKWAFFFFYVSVQVHAMCIWIPQEFRRSIRFPGAGLKEMVTMRYW